MKTGLIISVYKNIDALQLILRSLQFQTHKDFTIIVAEDGESVEMKSFIFNYHSPFEIQHITHEDLGWRKNKILNKAISETDCDYYIVIDGDCVLHHRFVEMHSRFASDKIVLGGKRVKLGPLTSDLLKSSIDKLPCFEKHIQTHPLKFKKDGTRFYEECFYLNPDSLFGKLSSLQKMSKLKGCNMSFSRKAIEAINGFDEDYVLPAIGEDIDLTWRFQGLGYKIGSVRNRAIQYHLYHKENWTDQRQNEKIMEVKKAEKAYRCKNGLIKY